MWLSWLGITLCTRRLLVWFWSGYMLMLQAPSLLGACRKQPINVLLSHHIDVYLFPFPFLFLKINLKMFLKNYGGRISRIELTGFWPFWESYAPDVLPHLNRQHRKGRTEDKHGDTDAQAPLPGDMELWGTHGKSPKGNTKTPSHPEYTILIFRLCSTRVSNQE